MMKISACMEVKELGHGLGAAVAPPVGSVLQELHHLSDELCEECGDVLVALGRRHLLEVAAVLLSKAAALLLTHLPGDVLGVDEGGAVADVVNHHEAIGPIHRLLQDAPGLRALPTETTLYFGQDVDLVFLMRRRLYREFDRPSEAQLCRLAGGRSMGTSAREKSPSVCLRKTLQDCDRPEPPLSRAAQQKGDTWELQIRLSFFWFFLQLQIRLCFCFFLQLQIRLSFFWFFWIQFDHQADDANRTCYCGAQLVLGRADDQRDDRLQTGQGPDVQTVHYHYRDSGVTQNPLGLRGLTRSQVNRPPGVLCSSLPGATEWLASGATPFRKMEVCAGGGELKIKKTELLSSIRRDSCALIGRELIPPRPPDTSESRCSSFMCSFITPFGVAVGFSALCCKEPNLAQKREPTKATKTRKLRGHVSHGHGRIGKHRKHPGGRGNAGGMHHHRINFDKYHPGYFGKVGMRHYHLKRNTTHCPTINLDKLWTLVSEQTRINYGKKPDGPAPIIDAVRAGYYKVLGKGKLPKQPVIVKAKFFSRRAEEKIKAAGGACVLMA
ncbi:hypothetical protein F7725_023265 [Dissostichus mawsoni]|uniref:Large ribosomal subunit protein uL15 n=3 Tax=Notothenioidei TaxID=8205 RepID=A0A7J5Z0K4_DISMA|nr:hypothetical protein F7725_023265 [Dissostichus mawsoni]